MKLKTVFALILSLSVLATSAYAVENISVDPAISSQDHGAADTFRAVVTGNDKLILKPGAVFTQGDDSNSIELPYVTSYNKSIRYPRWALHQGWQGEFVLAVEITPAGNVGRYSVMKSTGYKILDEAATKAVRTWQFHPAMKKGQPVLTCIQIPVRFQIDRKS